MVSPACPCPTRGSAPCANPTHLLPVVTIQVDHDYVYNESMKLVNEVRDKRSLNRLNKRWRAFTGDGTLEVKWKTLEMFDKIGAADDAKQGKENNQQASNELELLKDSTPVMAFDFKDENDAELEGEDMDGLVL